MFDIIVITLAGQLGMRNLNAKPLQVSFTWKLYFFVNFSRASQSLPAAFALSQTVVGA